MVLKQFLKRKSHKKFTATYRLYIVKKKIIVNLIDVRLITIYRAYPSTEQLFLLLSLQRPMPGAVARYTGNTGLPCRLCLSSRAEFS